MFHLKISCIILHCFVTLFFSGERLFCILAKFSCTIPQFSLFHTLKWGSSLPSFFPLRDSISEYSLRICSSTLHCATVPSFWEMRMFHFKFFFICLHCCVMEFFGYRLPNALAPSLITFYRQLWRGEAPYPHSFLIAGDCQKSLLHWARIPYL